VESDGRFEGFWPYAPPAGAHIREEAGSELRRSAARPVYAFNTPFYGSQAGQKLPSPVIGITAAG
jgi:hypothetical protein